MSQQNPGDAQPDPRTILEKILQDAQGTWPAPHPPAGAAGPWVDWPATESFLQLLGLDLATTHMRAIVAGGGSAVKLPPVATPQAEQARRQHAENLQASGYSLYFLPNGGPTDADVHACQLLFVEWDDLPIAEQLLRPTELKLPLPTASLETGGKSVHHYWRIDQSLPADQWRDLISRLITLCGSDPACKNPSRLMRLPGSRYWPKDGSVAAKLKLKQDPRELLRFATLVNGVGQTWLTSDFVARLATVLPAPDPKAQPEPDALRDLLNSIPKRRSTTAKLRADTIDDVRDALAVIPPRMGAGNNTYSDDRNRAWGLLKAIEEIGGSLELAAQLLITHSPAWGARAIRQVLTSGGDKIAPGTFWWHAQQHGYVNKRLQRPEPPAPSGTPMPTAAELQADPTLQQEIHQAAQTLVMDGGRILDLFAVFPGNLAQAMIDTAEVQPCDPQAFVLPLLCTAGSVLGRKVATASVKHAVGLHDPNWREQPQIWGVNLGDASQGKSNSSGFFSKALHTWQARLNRAHKAAEAQWAKDHADACAQGADADGATIDAKTAQANWRDNNPKPDPCRHVIVSDATLEVIGTYLSAPDCPGLVAFHDEMRSWFEALQRGGQQGKSQRGDWLPLWQGAAVVTDRLGRENVFSKSSSISIFGAMQPKVLSLLRGREAKANDGEVLADGMWGRFLLVAPLAVSYRSLRNLPKRPRLDLSPIIENTILRGLDELLPLQHDADGEIVQHLADWELEAAQMMHAQHETWHDMAEAAGEGERSEWIGKLRGTSMRFALILHCLALAMQGVGTLDRLPPIGIDSARRALVLAEWFRSQYEGAQPLFGGEVEGLPKPIAKLITKAKARKPAERKNPVSVRQAGQWRIGGSQAREDSIAVLSAAVEAGIGALVFEAKDGQQCVAAWLPPDLWPKL